MSNEVENRGDVHHVEQGTRGGLRVGHTLGVVALGVVGVVVAFWVLSFIAGILWGVVKLGVIVAVVGGILWLLLRRARH